jgi:hypothetical protein
VPIGRAKLIMEELEINKKALKAVQELAQNYQKMFEDGKKMQKSISNFQNESAYLLSTFGWYISDQIPYIEVLEILKAAKEKRIEYAESELINYYRNNIVDIISRIISKNKDREKIIIEALNAYKQGMFYASTILFLSQADGICDGKIFVSGKNKLSTLDKDNTPPIIFAALGKQSAIDEDSRIIESNYNSDLNRHNVMHGLRCDYGNQLNSLKALSLLSFVANFANRYKDVTNMR